MIRVKLTDNEVITFGGNASDTGIPYYTVQDGVVKIKVRLKEPVEAFDPETGENVQSSDMDMGLIPVHSVKMLIVMPDPPKSGIEDEDPKIATVPASALGALKKGKFRPS